jgi:hypothetical protein
MEELCYKIFNNFLQVKNREIHKFFFKKEKKGKSLSTFAFFI